jgi:hypothetical protein
MRTFEIDMGNGITEVIDLGDDSPLIKSFEVILKGQTKLEKKIQTLQNALDTQKALNRGACQDRDLYKTKLHRAKEILGSMHAELKPQHKAFWQELEDLEHSKKSGAW